MAARDATTQTELERRAARIAQLQADFESTLRDVGGKQRALLERVLHRIDEEKMARLRKSLDDIASP